MDIAELSLPGDMTGWLLAAACGLAGFAHAVTRARGRRRARADAYARIAQAMPILSAEVAAWGASVIRIDWHPRLTAMTVVFTAQGRSFTASVRGAASHEEAILAAARVIADARLQGDDEVPGEPTNGDGVAYGSWRDVLGVGPNEGLREAEASWKRMARMNHPDAGGDPTTMAAINIARDQARMELA